MKLMLDISKRVCFVWVSVGICLTASPTLAQIVPDETLGSERSQLIPNQQLRDQLVDRIESGAIRGANLFHSFQEFNVRQGQQVYFANPAGIENILSRVTGSNPSRILGTLGVDGVANLFLLNPNGIVFGPNARLDVRGSFVASTGSSFKFPDGSEFSATNPQAPPLLTVNVPLGLQVGASRIGATIAHAGQFTAPQDLTLIGDRLWVQGTLQAGGNLNLQAQDTVTLRDTPVTPLRLQSGRHLTVQGDRTIDLFALHHPHSGLFAGQDIVLRSPGAIGGDAHYTAGGNFRVEQLDGSLGTWNSPYDPVIRATGDVSFGTYTGASLHILAGGSVTANTITITGPDATNGLTETVTLSDGTALAIAGKVRPTLDIRAGTLAVGTPGSTGTPSPAGLTTPATATTANITVTAIAVQPANGLVYLSNQYQPNLALPGDITVGAISTARPTGDGGAVVIDSRDRLTVNGRINTIAAQGTGGSVTLLADDDLAINTPANATQPYGAAIFAAGQRGGAITIKGNNAVTITGTGNRSLFPINNGSLSPTVGLKGEDITVSGRVITLSKSGTISSTANNGANSGNITVRATEAIVLDSSEISTTVFPNARGQGGSVSINAPTLRLQNRGQLLTVTAGRGNAGPLSVNADAIALDNNSLIGSTVIAGASGNAGAVTVNGRSLVSNGSALFSSTFGAGNAGTLTLNLTDAIVLDQASRTLTSIETGATGQSGNTRINTGLLSLKNGSQIRTTTRGTQNAGNIGIQADTILVDGVGSTTENPSGIASSVLTGGTGAGGDIAINARIVTFTNGGAISANTNSTNADPIRGRAGNVTIEATEAVSFDGIGALGFNTGIRVETFLGVGQGGAIAIATPFLSLTNGAQLRSNTQSTGNAGNLSLEIADTALFAGADSGLFAATTAGSRGNGGRIVVNAGTVKVQDGAQIAVDSQGFGAGGDVQLQATTLTATNGGRISSTTTGPGNAGNLNFFVTDSIELAGANTGFFASTAPGSSGNGGRIFIDPESITLRDGARIAVDSEGSGLGGDIQIQTNRLTLDGGLISADTASTNGGNITLQVGELLLLRRGSRISTNAGTAQAGGDGGNIFIDAPTAFIVGVRSENSDITANAFTGQGGRVQINAQGIFGLQFRTQLSPESDITASSAFGVNGIVEINTPDVDPSKTLSPLPTNPIEPADQIAQNCAPRSRVVAKQVNEFVITGRGGLPDGPDTLLPSSEQALTPLSELVYQGRSPVGTNELNRDRAIASPPHSQDLPAAPDDPLVEAHGWLVTSDGAIVLVASTPATVANNGWQTPPCPPPLGRSNPIRD